MHIGRRLYKLRTANNLSQKDLAHGIISTSHLSNIENGRHRPDSYILELFAVKLKCPKDYLTRYYLFDQELQELLLQIQELNQSNLEEAKKSLELIERKYPYINALDQELLYYLLKCSYLVKSGQIKVAEKIFETEVTPLISESLDDFPMKYKEIYSYLRGVFSYINNKFYESYNWYIGQLELTQNDVSRAQIMHNIALALYQLFEYPRAIIYAEKALNIYLREHRWEHAADTELLIGILYWRQDQLENAEIHIKKVWNLVEQFKIDTLIGPIYHNLGLIYQRKKDLSNSVKYFQESLKYPYVNRVFTYYSLLGIYLDGNNISDIPDLLEEAFGYCENEFQLHYIKIMEAKYHLIRKESELYESLMEKIVQFFYKNNYWEQLWSVSEELGDYFWNLKRYKKASENYKFALESYRKIEGRKTSHI